MIPRRAWTWIVFWAGVCIVILTLGWASYSVYQLEERNAEVRAMAERQELIQRALWRIDSRIAPIIALEASRPYTDYEELQTVPSDLFREAIASGGLAGAGQGRSYATQYFQYDRDSWDAKDAGASVLNLGAQVDDGVYSASRFSGMEDEESVPAVFVSHAETVQTLDDETRQQQTGYDFQARKAIADIASQNMESPAVADERADKVSRLRKKNEKAPSENDSVRELADSVEHGYAPIPAPSVPSSSTLTNRAGVEVGGFTPQWMTANDGAQQLVLVRTVIIEGESIVQGVWLDWPALNAELIAAVEDIMPTSSITPASPPFASNAYPLATIPAAFIPGGALAMPAQSLTPAMIAMLVTWIAIIVSIIAIAVVLRAALNLSDRRGRFVTAVTHELRTPLTTFRLYSQMLADGMVSDETVRAQYLTTLKRESERLTGIVENVLEYARLSRRRSPKDKAAGVQSLTPDALIVRFRPALTRRVEQSNMDLVTSIDLAGHEDRTVTVDPHAVERIMMNLIENACKYAASPEGLTEQASEEFDTRIHLDVTLRGSTLELLVADHGPGIDPKDRARVFGEFQRGSRKKDLNRSGLGLGLALSRGLASEMDGDLQLVTRRRHGAEFLFTIPLDDLPLPPQGTDSG